MLIQMICSTTLILVTFHGLSVHVPLYHGMDWFAVTANIKRRCERHKFLVGERILKPPLGLADPNNSVWHNWPLSLTIDITRNLTDPIYIITLCDYLKRKKILVLATCSSTSQFLFWNSKWFSSWFAIVNWMKQLSMWLGYDRTSDFYEDWKCLQIGQHSTNRVTYFMCEV
jgi:hypothetical protein